MEKMQVVPEANSLHLKMDGWKTTFLWDDFLAGPTDERNPAPPGMYKTL